MGDNIKVQANLKPAGCSTSVYIKPRNMRHYEGVKRLAAQNDRSFSEVLNDSMKQVYFQQRTKVTVSAEAYLAIANGDLSRLDVIQRSDGTAELVVDTKIPFPDSYECPDRTFPSMDCRKAHEEGAKLLEQAAEPVAKQARYTGGMVTEAEAESEKSADFEVDV